MDTVKMRRYFFTCLSLFKRNPCYSRKFYVDKSYCHGDLDVPCKLKELLFAISTINLIPLLVMISFQVLFILPYFQL